MPRPHGLEGPSKKRSIAEPLIADLPEGTPATPQERGFDGCPCPKAKCSLRADCLACVAYHGRKGRPPRCAR